ncbi:1,2-phenylacetyl-CoA epoxidase subunit PaaC [Roseobacteraceae bacterium S113]
MDPHVEFLLRQGDNTLILGQRLSEWCGHAPILEEDIALANIALDLIGQTQMWLGLAGEIEGKGRSADDLAMTRDVWDFRNLLLVEQPNRDFGVTILRQYLFDQFHKLQLDALSESNDIQVAGIAAKALKEVSYHLERSAETVIALGDGSDESHARMQDALERLWPYVGEMFEDDEVDHAAFEAGRGPLPSSLQAPYDSQASAVLAEATLTPPDVKRAQTGGRSGTRHSEHLGHLLTTMQWLQRAYPGATW